LCLGENPLCGVTKFITLIENDTRRRKGRVPMRGWTDSLDSRLGTSVGYHECLDGRDGSHNKVTGHAKRTSRSALFQDLA
jgi:hypothetical protein